ncbi:MAG: outer membrane beta-barrel protein [Gammaproteobacteria bacterium]
MKKITKISAILLSSMTLVGLANAAEPGAYAGIGLGASSLKTPDSYYFNVSGANASNSRQRGGLGGRIFGGYNFNEYMGLEAGFATYANSTFKGSSNGSNSSVKYGLNAASLVAKGYLPFGMTGFNGYALGGLAEVQNQVRYSNGGVPLAVTAGLKNGTTNYYSIRPQYGLGVSYDIDQHLTTNVELSRIQGKGNVKTSASAIPNADMLSLNLGYNFG